MPDQPHEYTIRGETPDEEFDWFVLHVREHGHRAESATAPTPTSRLTGGGIGR